MTLIPGDGTGPELTEATRRVLEAAAATAGSSFTWDQQEAGVDIMETAGTPLPALWHWLYFLPLHKQSEIGPDGHARRGGFLPPVPLPRRMWAGSQFEFHKPLRIGDAISQSAHEGRWVEVTRG